VRNWTSHQQELRDSFADSFAAWGEDHVQRDQNGAFPYEQWKLVGQSGLFGLPFDRLWGGLGQDLLTTMYVAEGLGYGCRDGGLNFSVSTQIVSAGISINKYGSEYLKQRYLPRITDGSLIGAHAITEPHSGSDAAAMGTMAVRRGDTFVLNGQKSFVSNGPVADVIVVYTRTAPGSGPFGMTAIVVDRDTPGLTVGPSVDKMGLRTSPFGSLLLENCVVPAANVVGSVGKGFLVLDYVMKWEILLLFSIAVGTMRHRLERCIEFVRTRTQFGQPIGQFQSIANKIIDMKSGVETSSKWLYDAAERFLAGQNVTIDIAVAKLLASEANLKSAADAVQIFGGRGYLVEFGLEKELRDATGGTIYAGTSEVQRSKIARMLKIS
jgi:alkylation response protein AidB-like acyl-CoA dehydrogenase